MASSVTTIRASKSNPIIKEIRPLPISFYSRDTLSVSKELLGKYLIRQTVDHRWISRIVEVEAYIGHDDPASHAYRGLTPRTKIMFGAPGHAYVYFTYGMYFMLNVVTEREGFPAAILIRALEPVSGFAENDDTACERTWQVMPHLANRQRSKWRTAYRKTFVDWRNS